MLVAFIGLERDTVDVVPRRNQTPIVTSSIPGDSVATAKLWEGLQLADSAPRQVMNDKTDLGCLAQIEHGVGNTSLVVDPIPVGSKGVRHYLHRGNELLGKRNGYR